MQLLYRIMPRPGGQMALNIEQVATHKEVVGIFGKSCPGDDPMPFDSRIRGASVVFPHFFGNEPKGTDRQIGCWIRDFWISAETANQLNSIEGIGHSSCSRLWRSV